ncbi:hypothetical protein OS493_033460 [Desmophyllum pertusum]|uniref:Uncharacterized protein n=1 Tax=Desmophyllum pertusum TaxID=174260 RepID=A0A9W9ZWG0_9CNID|nr:hypothetical protein OS493_033460 [Desmophyllum pertusum]
MSNEEVNKEDIGRGWKSNNYSKKKLFKAGTSATGSGEVKNSGVDSREERKPKALSCPLCKDPPDLDLCKQFLKMSLAERRDVIRVKALYLGCLKWGHTRKDCRGR